MLVFLDTEFTNFAKPGLVSIALVAEDGQEFYAELVNCNSADCSEFVREAVLPLLNRVSGAGCTQPVLTERLRSWFESLPEPATIIFDFEGDWLLLADALLGEVHRQAPPNVGDAVHLASHTIDDPVFVQALNCAYTQQWPRHHALADARALMAGFRAWKASM